MKPFGPIRSATFLLGLFAGCASQGERPEPPLPFHVAVVPLASGSLQAPKAESGRVEEDLSLSLDAASVSREITASLEGKCFARATLLPYPAGLTAEEFENRTNAERNAHWVEASAAAGADLLLECDLRYAPAIASDHNEKFWMNLPLFLLGGPACYFVNDVSYVGEARLDGNVLDLNAVRARLATLDDGRAHLLHVESRFQEATLDFLDRAGGNVGLYGLSILVPAGFLSHESSSAEERLSEEVASHLARGLARAMREGSSEILVAGRLAGFHLDPKYTVEIRDGAVHFQGEAVLSRGDRERMESYAVQLGQQTTSGEFGEGTLDSAMSTRRNQYLRYPFSADFSLEPGADHLAIQLTGGGPNPAVRTFTIALADREPDRDATVASIP